MTIAAAVKAFREGNTEVALKGLLAEWRKTRAPALADAIAVVGDAIERPAVAGTRDKRVAAWKKRNAKKDPADVGVLLRGLDGLRVAEAAPLLKLIAEWPADPRTWSALFALFESPPTGLRGREAAGHWQQVLKILEGLADPRTRDRRAAIAKALRGGDDIDKHRHLPDTTETMLGCLAAVKAGKPAAAKTLAAGDVRLLADLKPAARGDLPSLFAKVYAEPRNDGARQILADALLEGGDPRGELINLQLLPKPDAAQKKRITQLLEKHARAWLGPLEPAVLKSGLVYRRGFPAEAKLSTNQTSVVKAVMGRPEWGTFERLDVASWPADERKAFLSQPLPGLRSAFGLENAVDLPDRVIDWEEVWFRYVGPEQMKAICALKTLPKLKKIHFDFVFDGPFPYFWKSPIASTVDSIVDGFNLDDWAHHAPPNVVHFKNYKTVAERTPQGLVVQISCDWAHGVASSYAGTLGDVKKLLHRATFTVRKDLAPEEMKKIEAAVKGKKIEWIFK